MFKWKKLGLVAGLSLSLIAAGCGADDTEDADDTADNGNDDQAETTEGVGEEVDYTITGIEPGAGITQATNTALEDYENLAGWHQDRKSTRLNSSHVAISYAVFCLKKKSRTHRESGAEGTRQRGWSTTRQ